MSTPLAPDVMARLHALDRERAARLAGNPAPTCAVGKTIQEIERAKREDYEERAGILEFCGNLPREEAEREAARMVYGEPKA